MFPFDDSPHPRPNAPLAECFRCGERFSVRLMRLTEYGPICAEVEYGQCFDGTCEHVPSVPWPEADAAIRAYDRLMAVCAAGPRTPSVYVETDAMLRLIARRKRDWRRRIIAARVRYQAALAAV